MSVSISRAWDETREERGWFDRARDELTSWFGDERDDDRRPRDDDRWSAHSDRTQRQTGERDYGRYERSPRYRDEGYRRPYTINSRSF